MVRGEGSEAEESAGNGDLVTLCKGDNLLLSAGLDDAVARKNKRLFRRLDQLDRLLDRGGFRAQHRMRTVRSGSSGLEIEGGSGLLGVLGDVDEDRAGTS